MSELRDIVRSVKQIAEEAAIRATGVTTGTILSVNPDGSVNVDDGSGGCARVENIRNQPIQCGGQIVLGVEPSIGNTQTVCPVSIAVEASTKPCPTDDRTDENEKEEVQQGAPGLGHYFTVRGMFVDDWADRAIGQKAFFDESGNVYSYSTGALLTETGRDFADVDPAFGYSVSGNDFLAGVSPSYADLVIGTDDGLVGSGYQGETYFANNTRLCRGLGPSVGILCGAEIANLPGGGHAAVWTINLRSAADFSLLASNAATYISDYMNTTDPSGYPGDNVSYDVNISADPDGTFWVGIGGNSNHSGAFLAPLFNISSEDGSLLSTVELQVPDQFFQRAGVIGGGVVLDGVLQPTEERYPVDPENPGQLRLLRIHRGFVVFDTTLAVPDGWQIDSVFFQATTGPAGVRSDGDVYCRIYPGTFAAVWDSGLGAWSVPPAPDDITEVDLGTLLGSFPMNEDVPGNVHTVALLSSAVTAGGISRLVLVAELDGAATEPPEEFAGAPLRYMDFIDLDTVSLIVNLTPLS